MRTSKTSSTKPKQARRSLFQKMQTQEELWNKNFEEVAAYIREYKRCPSKHRIQDHRMLNWIKYNKKRMAQGRLSPERTRRFLELKEAMKPFHKLNQYAYASQAQEELDFFQELL